MDGDDISEIDIGEVSIDGKHDIMNDQGASTWRERPREEASL
jgi:hypothetical protein